MPALSQAYRGIVISLPPGVNTRILEAIKANCEASPRVSVIVNSQWSAGRFSSLKHSLVYDPAYIQYADMDRLLRWVETSPEEWRKVLSKIPEQDYLVIGRTQQAYRTHPQALIDTERLSNQVVSYLVGRDMDVSAGSKGFSRWAAEFILANTQPEHPLGADGEWTVLLHRAGVTIGYIEVDGLDWETADRYQDQAAGSELQKQMAEAYDKDADHWSERVRIANEIIRMGLESATRSIHLPENTIVSPVEEQHGGIYSL